MPLSLSTSLLVATLAAQPQCQLEVSHIGEMVTIKAQILASAAVSGQYQLIISKKSSSGQSQSMSSGPFALSPSADGPPPARKTVSIQQQNLPPNASMEIDLSIEVSGHRLNCHKTIETPDKDAPKDI